MRLLEAKYSSDLVSISTTLSDDRAEIESVARLDNDSDNSLVSRSLAKETVLKGIVKILVIEIVRIKRALQKVSDDTTFTFHNNEK